MSTSIVQATLDGFSIEVPTGSTILQAARGIGLQIPTLCHSDQLKPYGACRVCLVEVAGGRPVASCHTPVREGAVYTTRSERLTRLRRNIVELIVSDHPLECLPCAANGRCALQSLAADLGLRQSPYQAPATHNPPADHRHPFVKMDMAKCIGCGRCVRACDEVQGAFVLGMQGRGFDIRVIAGNDASLEAAGCVSCGQCVVECPVAALEEPGTLNFGLADRQVRTTCAYCGVGCSLIAQVKDGRVTQILPNPEGSANRGHLCVKGRFAHGYVRSPERLTSPLIRGPDGRLREAGWDEALGLIATRFTEIRERHGPTGFGAISSSRCTNEENYLMQKFTRVVMGTNSVDNCSRVCHSPSAFALGAALGTGAGTNSFQDVALSDVLLIVGANPTEAHPVFGARIRQAVLKGCKLIVIDPRRTELARLADIHLPLRPGANVAVINALQQVLIAEGLIDQGFIDRHAEGLERLADSLAHCTPEWAAQIAGLDPEAIRAAARLYASGRRAQILWGLGVTEAGHGTHAAFGLINLAVLTGNLGRPGTGASPIRGQNNVQGACDVGALPNVFSDYRPLNDAAARADHLRVWGLEPPATAGLRIPEMFDAVHDGDLKAMYILAEDVAQSDPHTQHVVGALERLEFLVVQEIFLSETAKYAHVVLPGAAFLEKEGTFVNSDRRIQPVRKAVEPPGLARADADITHAIAARMGVDLGFALPGTGTPPRVDNRRVLDELAALSPKWGGVSWQRIEELGFIQWPCPTPDHPGTDIVHRDGNFLRGRARLTPAGWNPPGEAPDPDYPFILVTGRQLLHYNAGTQTRRTDVVQLLAGAEDRVQIHPEDAARLGICDDQPIGIASRRGAIRVQAQVTDAVRPGNLFMTFHFPQTRTNSLIGDFSDSYTMCPEYKVCAVSVSPGRRSTG